MWNGNWADLVNAPARKQSPAAVEIGDASASSAVNSNVPCSAYTANRPNSIASPPMAVSPNALVAPSHAAGRCQWKPISRKDDTLVSSQKTSSSTRLSASTTPIMAALNSSSRRYSRGRPGSPRMYDPAYANTAMPTPEIKPANSQLRPSIATLTCSPSSGAHGQAKTSRSPSRTAVHRLPTTANWRMGTSV